MVQKFDFEKYWLAKFSKCVEAVAGEKVSQKVMEDSQNFSDETPRTDIIHWSKEAIERLETLVDEKKQQQIMTGCACQYPKKDLEDVKQKYAETHNIDDVHQMLLVKFENFLKEKLKLNENLIREILKRGWGLAGVRDGNTIIATKIPKSGYLVEYMEETDPTKKRALYCHCPRIRDIFKSSEKISPTYCYCGAGFYKGIWEEILQKPVKVEILENLFKGDDVCKIAVHLPVDE